MEVGIGDIQEVANREIRARLETIMQFGFKVTYTKSSSISPPRGEILGIVGGFPELITYVYDYSKRAGHSQNPQPIDSSFMGITKQNDPKKYDLYAKALQTAGVTTLPEIFSKCEEHTLCIPINDGLYHLFSFNMPSRDYIIN